MSPAFSLAHGGSLRIDTDRLRQQHPIVDLVNRYGIELRRSGSSLIGRCPFHVDRGRPNLTVYPRSGRFVCYRCGASGDAISFVQQLEHLTFREAASQLGAEPDLLPPTRRVRVSAPKTTHVRTPDASQLAVLSAALDLYRGRLMSDSGALAYLASRGFSRELVDQLHVGYAKGDELVHYLVWRNLPVSSGRRVGLLEPDGSERLRGRIVFPEIRHGQPIWFIGRQLDPDDSVPKYLGLPGRKPLLGIGEFRPVRCLRR
jgi:DNA primase